MKWKFVLICVSHEAPQPLVIQTVTHQDNTTKWLSLVFMLREGRLSIFIWQHSQPLYMQVNNGWDLQSQIKPFRGPKHFRLWCPIYAQFKT